MQQQVLTRVSYTQLMQQARLIRLAVVAEAPEGSLEKKVIYPVAVVKATAHEDAAKAFVDFLTDSGGNRRYLNLTAL